MELDCLVKVLDGWTLQFSRLILSSLVLRSSPLFATIVFEYDLRLFCWFWFCFLGFPSEWIPHSIFHLDERKRFAGYRCFGGLSLINALIGE